MYSHKHIQIHTRPHIQSESLAERKSEFQCCSMYNNFKRIIYYILYLYITLLLIESLANIYVHFLFTTVDFFYKRYKKCKFSILLQNLIFISPNNHINYTHHYPKYHNKNHQQQSLNDEQDEEHKYHFYEY